MIDRNIYNCSTDTILTNKEEFKIHDTIINPQKTEMELLQEKISVMQDAIDFLLLGGV